MPTKSRFIAWILSKIPTRSIINFNPRHEPQSLAAMLDVDRVHTIFISAENGDTTELFALYRDIIISDAHSQGEFAKRKLTVLGKVPSVTPQNERDPDDKKASLAIGDMINGLDSWINGINHLLDSTLWPVAVVEKVYAPSSAHGLRYTLDRLVPVPHQLLDFTTGHLRIKDLNDEGAPLGTSHYPDPERYIIHRGHLLTTTDNWGGPMRSIVFWWLLSVMDRGWWVRYLERYGSPFLVGKYDQDDDASRSILERAFSYASHIGGLVISRETEVEIKEAASSSGDYEKFLTICQREKSKLILGQSLSAEAQPTGMNSGQSSGAETVRQDIRIFDAMALGHTLRTQLFKQFLLINGIQGNAPAIGFGPRDTGDLKQLKDIMDSVHAAGMRITDDGISTLSQRMGITIERDPMALGSRRLTNLAMLTAGSPDPTLEMLNSIPRAGAAELAHAFRGRYAQARTIILESRTAAECEERIRTFCSELKPDEAGKIIEQAMEAFAANSAAT